MYTLLIISWAVKKFVHILTNTIALTLVFRKAKNKMCKRRKKRNNQLCGDLIEAVGEGSWATCLVKVVRMFEYARLCFIATMRMYACRLELVIQGWGEEPKLPATCLLFTVHYLMEAGNLSNEERVACLLYQRRSESSFSNLLKIMLLGFF